MNKQAKPKMDDLIKAFANKVENQSSNRLMAMHKAQIVIAINADGTMATIKNLNGKQGQIDLPELLELLLPYQGVFKSLLTEWITKLKKLRVFE